MLGQTTSQVGNKIKGEKLNLTLRTNQSDQSDLIGVIITVIHPGGTYEYTWEGKELTIDIPSYVNYTVSFSNVEDYKTPETLSFTAVNDNFRAVYVEYQTEIVSVIVSADDSSNMNGAVIKINGKSQTWNGITLTQKVAFGTSYTVVAGNMDGFVTPDSQTYIASQSLRNLSFVYEVSSIKVNILSNQDNDAAISSVKAIVTWVNYDPSSGDEPHMAYVGDGETVSTPSNVSVNITFPEVEGYKAPSPISFTHTGGQAEKTGTYQCELLTVNVTADSGTPTQFEVTIAKQETIGVTTKYTKLEYIEASGSQWVDSGFTPNNNSRMVIDFAATKIGETNHIIGARNSTTSKAFTFSIGSNGYWRIGYNNSSPETSVLADSERHIADLNKNVLKLDGTTIYTATAATFTGYGSIYIGAIHASNQYLGYTKIYSCQIYDNGTLVKDYIPALRSDGIAGLYDAVNDTFTASSGTGNFSFNSDYQEVIATQTSVTGTYKIPFDTSYAVEANSVSGYTSPVKVFHVASSKSYTVNQEYKVYFGKDLSMFDVYGNSINRSTANCYVVREPGQYIFPLVYGNAIKNGKVNTAAFTNNGGTNSHDFVNSSSDVITSPYIVTPETDASYYVPTVSNQDEEDIISNVSKITKDGIVYLSFSIWDVPSTGANVIVSLTMDGSVMWHWHLWLWPHDLSPVEITNSTGVKYNIMPVNLASKYDSDGVHIKNWFYQWGRMTPLLCPASYNSTSNHSPGTIVFSSRAAYVANGLSSPTTFYYADSQPRNWFSSSKYYNLWDAACTTYGNADNDVVKTVYDPCPVGWKVPNGNIFGGLSIINSTNGILKITRYSGDTKGVEIPMSGIRSDRDGTISNAGAQGYIWSANPRYGNGTQAFGTSLYKSTSSEYFSRTYFNCGYGISVRPVEDDNIQLDVIMISFTIVGTTYQAESGMTWFEWVNSEYNTGGYIIKDNVVTTPSYSEGDYESWTIVDEKPYYYNVFSGTNIIGGWNYVHAATVAP